jgi:predicted metal-dependent peptidase
MKNKDAKFRISKMRTFLILEFPFWGTLAMKMPMTLSDEVPTAATNGLRVLFNESFVNSLSDDELLFLGCHEIGHPMLEHIFRRGERDPEGWNIACDIVLNQLLVNEGIGKMPSIGVLDEELYDAAEGQAEKVYDLLLKRGKGCGPGDEPDDRPGGYPGRGPLDQCEDGAKDQAEREQRTQEWKVAIAQAAQAAKMCGKLSAGIEQLVGEILNPKVPWRQVLQQFVVKTKTDQRTFARPNRRFASQGLYLPSTSGEAMGELLVAVDCSGSVGENEMNQFAAELQSIKDELNPQKLHVTYFDSRVSHYEVYEQGEDLDIRPHGGGGTAFSPVFRYVEENGIEPLACVFLTDLYCYDFGDQPSYPVLWVTTGREEAPWGQVVKMEL